MSEHSQIKCLQVANANNLARAERAEAALTKAEQDIIRSMSEVRRLEIRAQCAEAALADLAEVIEKIARLCALFTRSIK